MQARVSESGKYEAIEKYRNGYSVKELCEEYGVSKSSIYNWISKYSTMVTQTGNIVSARRLDVLEKRIKRISMENEIFRKCNCSVSAPLEKKLKTIEKYKDIYSVHALCSVLGVRRSTFYYHLNRKPGETVFEKADKELKPQIKKIFADSKGRYGAKKICAGLEKEGIVTAPRRVRRLMKEMKLQCNIKKLPRRGCKPEDYYSKNLVKQHFNPKAPNLIWVSDVTMVKIQEEKVYICVVIDLFSGKVIAANTSGTNNTSLIAATFSEAFFKRKCPKNLIFHSDQGSQYTSYLFSNLLLKLKVKQSLSKPGCPYDNAVCESFFSHLKKEEINRSEYENIAHLASCLSTYIHFYNKRRPHQSLNYQTPDEVEKAYAK